MENPPELKGVKQKHNVRTLKKMAEMMVSSTFPFRLLHTRVTNADASA